MEEDITRCGECGCLLSDEEIALGITVCSSCCWAEIDEHNEEYPLDNGDQEET